MAIADNEVSPIPAEINRVSLLDDVAAIEVHESRGENEIDSERLIVLEKPIDGQLHKIGEAVLGFTEIKLPTRGTLVATDIDSFDLDNPYFTHSAYLALIQYISKNKGSDGSWRPTTIYGRSDIRMTGVAYDLQPYLPEGWKCEFQLHRNSFQRDSIAVPTFEPEDILEYLKSGKMINHTFKKVS